MEIYIPDTKTVSLFFNKLMETPIKIYELNKSISNIGTKEITKTLYLETKCNYHSISSDKAVFRDKVGDKSVFLVCLPMDTVIGDPNNYTFEIENKEYQVLGVRQASRKYELVFEVVLYE